MGSRGARRLEPPESDAREEDETSDDARRRSWSAMTGRARKCQSWSGRDDFRADEPASGGARHDRRFARVPKRRRRGGSPAVCAPRVRRTRAGLCDARADAFARRDCCWIFEAWCWRVARVLRVYLGPRAAPPGDLPTVAPRHRLPRATMDPEAGEAPTPASAVDLRKPLRMTALYLVTFTALLVGASLAPTADAVDKPAVASARRVMEAPEPRPSALSRVVAPLERDHAVPAPPADELSPAAVAVGADGGGEGDAPSSSSLPECAFHVYRHLSKTGGTTVRFVFDKQTAMGEWEYPLSYGFDEAQWTALLARWRAAARAWRAGDRAEGTRTLVEVRGNWPSNWPAENFARPRRRRDAQRRVWGFVRRFRREGRHVHVSRDDVRDASRARGAVPLLLRLLHPRARRGDARCRRGSLEAVAGRARPRGVGRGRGRVGGARAEHADARDARK